MVGNGESQCHYGLLKVQPFRQKNKDGNVPAQPSRWRVFWALLVYPPNLIIITSTALLFAGLYAILVDFTRLWLDNYGWSEAEAGYAYLCPGKCFITSSLPLLAHVLMCLPTGIFLFVGSLAGGKASDLWRARAVKASPDGKVPPESRIFLQTIGYVATAAGLIMFGWFCEYHLHPAAVLVASAIGKFCPSSFPYTHADPI